MNTDLTPDSRRAATTVCTSPAETLESVVAVNQALSFASRTDGQNAHSTEQVACAAGCPVSTNVVIVGGGGGVGASVAFNLLIGGHEFDVVMTDRRPEMARSHVLDLEQVLEQGARGTVREGS